MFNPRSKQAFIFTVQQLYARNKRIYFWTLTFKNPQTTWQAAPCFNRFLTALKQRQPDILQGLRVWEMHPGGHGVHVHFLINRRVAIRWIKALGKWAGFGEVVWVKEADMGAALYLAKYLGKDRPLPGVRKWATFGHWEHTKCKDLIFKSRYADMLRDMYSLCKERKICRPQDMWGVVRHLVDKTLCGCTHEEVMRHIEFIVKQYDEDMSKQRLTYTVWRDEYPIVWA